MSSADPSPNDGDVPYLEPVTPEELNLDDIPVVEAVAATPIRARKPGFGFFRALLWCLLFLLTTQILPGLAIFGTLIVLNLPELIRHYKQQHLGTGIDELLHSNQMRLATQAAVIVAPVCGALFSVVVLRWSVGAEWKRRIAWRLPHADHVVLVVLLALPLMVFNISLEAALSRLIPGWETLGLKGMRDIMKEMETWPAWVLILGISIGPAISEELWCRGFLGQGLVSRYGAWFGVIATAFLFGFLHLQPLQSMIAFLMGIALHAVYLASRSLLIPMLLHFLNNFIAIFADQQDSPVPLGKTLEIAFQHRPLLMLIASFSLVLAIGVAFYRSRIRIVTPEGKILKTTQGSRVEVPAQSSADRALPGPIPAMVIGLLVTASCFFAAVWFGF